MNRLARPPASRTAGWGAGALQGGVERGAAVFDDSDGINTVPQPRELKRSVEPVLAQKEALACVTALRDSFPCSSHGTQRLIQHQLLPLLGGKVLP